MRHWQNAEQLYFQRADVDIYLQEQEIEAEVLWEDIEKRADYQEFGSRLLARRTRD